MKNVLPLLLSSIALALVLVGCDSTGSEEAVILSENQDIPPTVEYTFRYTSEDVSNNGQQVQVVSNNTDNLNSVLSDNGFERSDITSARVDSVVMERQSSPSSVRPKVFDYLSGASVFLGTSAGGTRIANKNPLPTQKVVKMDVATSGVTSTLQDGPQRSFLRLEASGEVPQEDRIDVTVYYRLEMQL